MVEITDGLAEGELVVLNPPAADTNVESFRNLPKSIRTNRADSQTVASSQH